MVLYFPADKALRLVLGRGPSRQRLLKLGKGRLSAAETSGVCTGQSECLRGLILTIVLGNVCQQTFETRFARKESFEKDPRGFRF